MQSNNQQNYKRTITVWVVIIMGLFTTNMVLSHTMFVTNTSIASLEHELVESQRQLQEYRVQMARVTSSEIILARAKKLGFVKSPTVLYLMNNEFAKR
ncbi:MAG: hypothetical protein NUV52_00045 [Candidatus Roizmanbacteria bacterium]|nr:hypothetical protein [Candidatus Roizmanbacteria bacterium]